MFGRGFRWVVRPRFRRAVMSVLLTAVLSVVLVGCASRVGHAMRVTEFLADPAAMDAGDVGIGGVFVTPPVTTAAGTIFAIADDVGSTKRLNVYAPNTHPLETPWGKDILSGDQLIGRSVIVTGRYDGQVLSATAVILQSGGTYSSSEAEPDR